MAGAAQANKAQMRDIAEKESEPRNKKKNQTILVVFLQEDRDNRTSLCVHACTRFSLSVLAMVSECSGALANYQTPPLF